MGNIITDVNYFIVSIKVCATKNGKMDALEVAERLNAGVRSSFAVLIRNTINTKEDDDNIGIVDINIDGEQ